MATTFFRRIFHLYNALNFLFFHLPKRIAMLLPTGWITLKHRPVPGNTHQPALRQQQEEDPPTPSLPACSIRPMEMPELRRVFQMFDRNGDGRITRKELADSLENLGIFIPERDLASLIEKVDTDGDGCVDLGEFEFLHRMIMDDKDERVVEEDMREAFDVFDQDRDGFITVEELGSVMETLGLKQGKTTEDCRRMIGRVDVDGDGMVDFGEFEQMMRGGGFAACCNGDGRS